MRRLLVLALLLPPCGALAQDYRMPCGDSDCGYFYPTSYYDHGGVQDWNCGSNSYSGHKGSDYGVGGFPGMYAGRDLVAAADGTVLATNDGEFDECQTGDCSGGGGYGNYVKLEHGDGKTTIYAHMRIWTVAVSAGQTVYCGQYLGQVGSSGYSTGPHIHFEVRESNGSQSDPFDGPCSSPPDYWTDPGAYGAIPGTACDGGQGAVDDDGDGYTEADGDCHDGDP
ncbi:MAG: M23 family metallopeptidase, partial [Myxococcota bacterium]|nr:M23 family metallopeptidase [Myxococcota bacterium]